MNFLWLVRRGIYMSNATVELMDVALKGCNNSAFHIPSSTSATTVVATRCEFANSGCGAIVGGSLSSATKIIKVNQEKHFKNRE